MIDRGRLKRDWEREMAGFDGQSLRQWREERNLNQDAMAVLLGLVARNAVRTIQDWEHGRTELPDWLRRMMWFFDWWEKAEKWGHLSKSFEDGETAWVKPPKWVPVENDPDRPPKRKYTKRNLEYWAGREAEREERQRQWEQDHQSG